MDVYRNDSHISQHDNQKGIILCSVKIVCGINKSECLLPDYLIQVIVIQHKVQLQHLMASSFVQQ